MFKKVLALAAALAVAFSVVGCADTVQTVDATKAKSAKVITQAFYDKAEIDKQLAEVQNSNSSVKLDGMDISEVAKLPVRTHNGKKCYYHKTTQRVAYNTPSDNMIVHKDGFMIASTDESDSAEWGAITSAFKEAKIDYTIKIKFKKAIAHKSKYVTLSKDKKTAIWKLSKCKKAVEGIYAYTKGSKHSAKGDWCILQEVQ